MSKIGLIDVDHHNFPNIALMKISAWHKKMGDNVEWYTPFEHYDIVYLSKVFSFSKDYKFPIYADQIIYGGTGYQIKNNNGIEYFNVYDREFKKFLTTKNTLIAHAIYLLDSIEHIYPDYSIYPDIKDTAFGFLTRGCPRGCKFCHVGTKEGKHSIKVADLSEFWKGQKNIVLCDPNILACKDWEELLQQLIDSKAWVDFNQGLDIRMMTEEKAQMLSHIKMKEVHFAWDRYQDKELVLPRLEMYKREYEKKRKWQPKHSIVYTLVNFNTTKEQDLDRIYTLRKMGYWAYIMVYDKEHCTDQFYKDIAR